MLFFVALCGDEIQKSEQIVKDTKQLSAKKEVSKSLSKEKNGTKKKKNVKKTASKYEKLLEKEKEKNKVLAKKVSIYNTIERQNSDLLEENKKLKLSLKYYEKMMESKENEILSLKNNFSINKEKSPYITQATEEDNVFPKLMMKEKPLQTEQLDHQKNANLGDNVFPLKGKAVFKR